MQISRLFDKYWIHENFSDTQPHSYMMLVKTLGKLIEHVCQHPFAPWQAMPLRILFCWSISPRRWWRPLRPPLHARTIPGARMNRIARRRRSFGPVQISSAASLNPRGAYPKRWFALRMGGPSGGEGRVRTRRRRVAIGGPDLS